MKTLSGPAVLLSFVERLSSFKGDISIKCAYKIKCFWLVLFWEVCPLLECPLSGVSL